MLLISAAYLGVLVLFVYMMVGLLRPGMYGSGVAAGIGWTASFFLSAYIVLRSVEMKSAALTTTYESLLFYGLCVLAVLSLYLSQNKFKRYPAVCFASAAAALCLLLLASSPLFPKDVKLPMPALRSLWLVLHVSFSFIGEGFFVFGFVTSAIVIQKGKTENIEDLDYLSYTAILIGYVFFTLGALIFGAVWAESAWGSFWSWDPKETWALITWLIYSLYLHVRLFGKTDSSVRAWISVAGFLTTVFTFFGVNYLLPSLHSYG